VRRVLPLDFEPSRKPPADLDVRILGQLPAAEFTLGDALEPRPLEIVGFDAPLGGGSLRKQQLNHAPRPRTTPRHSPISTLTSTACRSAFHRVSSGNDVGKRYTARYDVAGAIEGFKRQALGKAGETITRKTALHHRPGNDRMRRRDLMAYSAGIAITWVSSARAQQRMPVIGYLDSGSPEPDRVAAFRRGLNETGYIEGQNVAIEYLWAQGQYDRLPGIVADLVGRQVTVIVARGVPTVQAAKAATATIPIVFTLGVDPVQFGFVASLNRPGGNITGVVLLAELAAKRLDLLHEVLPTASIAALLVNPTNTANAEAQTTGLRDAAQSLGLQLHVLPASSASEIDGAFTKLVELRASALVVAGDPFLTSRRAQIVALAARHAVPAIYAWREFAAAGGLMSYGPDLADGSRLAGVYTGKILKGASPADLPVQQAVKIELVINLKTAKTLGLTIPLNLLARADEVIE
jgi:putative ABC transport system substrate-binding protein